MKITAPPSLLFRSARTGLALSLAAGLATGLAGGVQAQAPDPAAAGPAQTPHGHRDSSSWAIAGLLAGGAALMAQGGHGGGNAVADTSGAAVPAGQPQAGQPQAAGSVPTVVSLSQPESGKRPESGTPASPVLVTFPAATPAAAAPVAAPSFQPLPTAIAPAAPVTLALPPVALALPPVAPPLTAAALAPEQDALPARVSAPAPSVPEPPVSGTLLLGGLGIAALAARRRRQAAR